MFKCGIVFMCILVACSAGVVRRSVEPATPVVIIRDTEDLVGAESAQFGYGGLGIGGGLGGYSGLGVGGGYGGYGGYAGNYGGYPSYGGYNQGYYNQGYGGYGQHHHRY